jgi:bacterioferritin
LTIELTAINQYFLAGEQCANWGFPRLKSLFHGLSYEEMKDTKELIQHILYLEGLPNMQRLNQVLAGENVLDLYRAGLELELGAVENLRAGIAHCAEVGDFTTRAMLEEMIAGEEKHVDVFETQLAALETVGLERYLAQQVKADD